MTTLTQGGRRPGAGRKPRTDGRKRRLVSVSLTRQEYEAVKALTPDERRVVLMSAIKARTGKE